MHRDSIDRFEVHTVPSLVRRKRLGAYLLEAGLINEAQVEVALNDQQATGLKFGEVLSARGWIKQKTVEYLMKKVVIPERKAMEHKTHPQSDKTYSQADGVPTQATSRRAAPRRSPNPQAKPSARPGAPASKRQSVPNPAVIYAQQSRSSVAASRRSQAQKPKVDESSSTRREAPITKPLPSVSNPNDDVSWVG